MSLEHAIILQTPEHQDQEPARRGMLARAAAKTLVDMELRGLSLVDPLGQDTVGLAQERVERRALDEAMQPTQVRQELVKMQPRQTFAEFRQKSR